MDTTVAHKTTYTEWQLIKTQKTLEQTNLKLASTDKLRQEKILELGSLCQQLNSTRIILAKVGQEAYTESPKGKMERKKKIRNGRNYWR
jgi:hypothetical protein